MSKYYNTFRLSGLTCEACVYSVKYLMNNIDGLESIEIDENMNSADIISSRNISLEELQNSLKSNSKYKISTTENIIETKSGIWKTYKPLFIIASYILLISAIAARGDWMTGMRYFMAGFFIVFSFFKMLDIPSFASSYRMYDIIAARIPGYGLVYPFIELGLGILFLTNFMPKETNIVTLILMLIGSAGVLQSVLNKTKIRCACLGTVFNLPMSYITLIEDLLMAGMSIVMLMNL